MKVAWTATFAAADGKVHGRWGTPIIKWRLHHGNDNAMILFLLHDTTGSLCQLPLDFLQMWERDRFRFHEELPPPYSWPINPLNYHDDARVRYSRMPHSDVAESFNIAQYCSVHQSHCLECQSNDICNVLAWISSLIVRFLHRMSIWMYAGL